MEVVTTIVPIFIVILLGWGARKKGFITPEFLTPANRLVYYMSIPALVFGAIAKTSFREQFDSRVVSLTLLSVTIIYATAYLFSRAWKMAPSRAGAFIQSSGHGNVGYIGLPIAFYYLGGQGLATASIICGFIMVLQNLLSIFVLQHHDTSGRQLTGFGSLLKKLAGNPVIVSAMAGMMFSALAVPIPLVIQRIIDILGNLAPPMALLLIGASLSMQLIRKYVHLTMGAVAIKLILLPTCGLLLFSLFHLSAAEYLPAMILLCSPTATVVYVMAREMHNDADFSVAAISVSTLFSAMTFIIWLTVVELFVN